MDFAAALREAEEECGLRPAQVDLLGRLPDYVTGTGFRITPVVGLLPQGAGLERLAAGASDPIGIGPRARWPLDS